MSHLKNITIISINVNSILTIERKMNLIIFIEEHKPDIILLSETKLCKKSKFEIQGYNIIRNDRNKHGGGTAIILRDNIQYNTINYINYQLRVIECIIVEIK